MNISIIVMSMVSFFCSAVYPCSTFMLRNDSSVFVGKNYDWDVESGSIIINKRNVGKTAFKVDNPVSWTSRYGSITFNQYGQDFPIGGMNEKGLVIEALWLNETTYPEPNDTLRCIDNMQWIQFHLDNSADIEEIIKNDAGLQITPTSSAAVHCFAADASGKALVFESVNGIVHHYRPDAVNPPMLTNDPYDKSIRMLQQCKLFGGNLEVPRGKGSVTRFITLGIALQQFPEVKTEPVHYAFSVLKDVSLGGYTKWSIVYDVSRLTVYYKSRSNKKVRYVQLSRFNLNCDDNVGSLPVINNLSDNITASFKDFTIKHNSAMVQEAFRNTPFLQGMSEEMIREIYTYPTEHRCEAK